MDRYGILIVIIMIIFGIVLYKLRTQRYERLIQEKISGIGANLIRIEKRNFFSNIGPFKIVGKGRMVYCFVYEKDGNKKEGFVRFGGLFGPDWRL